MTSLFQGMSWIEIGPDENIKLVPYDIADFYALPQSMRDMLHKMRKVIQEVNADSKVGQ